MFGLLGRTAREVEHHSDDDRDHAAGLGTVRLFGRSFERAALARIGYLPEERGLYKKMNVLDQLVFYGPVARAQRRGGGAAGEVVV